MTFEQLQRKAIAEWEALENSEVPRLYIGTSTCARTSGALEVLGRIRAELEQRKINARLIEVGCLGCCALEPLVCIAKRGQPRICYGNVTFETVSELVTDYIVNENPRPDLALCLMGGNAIDGIPDISELPMLKSQVKIALRNCGHIDPANINHYIAHDGGYSGLFKALQMTPAEVIEEVSKSGLRGRGGAGFPTAAKWRICCDTPENEKFLICNAAEGDPGAFIGRSLLESDPHCVLEGMLIGAYAVGAARGYVYVNGEYALAIERLKTALRQMTDCGLLGDHILNSDFSFHMECIQGDGSLVSGEETALIRALEGRQAMPYARPPFPATSGLGGNPTTINNVETWTHVSAILQNGAEWYAGYGTEQSRGTKSFTLGGAVKYPGLIEVPMGTTLRHIVYNIGGGIPDGEDLKAVQIGGPTGGYLPAPSLDLPLDYEHLTSAGFIMGSGSIIVVASDACMVHLAKDALVFSRAESCGRCVFGREGTRQMAEILTDITDGKGKPEDIDFLLELGEGMELGALCALGKTAPNPALSTIKHFREEYEVHIKRKQCPAKVCENLRPSPAA
jgi:NADH-quinone oxidoreductase subunit F